MEVHITESEGTMTARLVGRLDTPAAVEVSREVQPLLDHAGDTLILDCSELTYISSSGLRIFLTLRKAAATKGGKVIVRGINADVRSVFMITGFLNLFEIQ